MPVSGPTPEELDRAIRELRKIQERHQLDYDEQAWLDTAVGFLAAYPLPPEDGERAQAAQDLGFACNDLRYYGVGGRAAAIAAMERAAALLRQPLPPPTAGVSKEEVLKVVAEERRTGERMEIVGVGSAGATAAMQHLLALVLDEIRGRIEALPEAAPGEREAVMAAVFRCGYNRGIDRAQDFARETASDLGPGGSVKPPAHPDAIAVLRAYARHLEEVVRQEGCPDAAVGALSADEVDRLLTGGHLRAAAPPSGVDREAVLASIEALDESLRRRERSSNRGAMLFALAELKAAVRALPEAKP